MNLRDGNKKDKGERLKKFIFARLEIIFQKGDELKSLKDCLLALPSLKRYPSKLKRKGQESNSTEVNLSKPKRLINEINSDLKEEFNFMFYNQLEEIGVYYLNNAGISEMDRQSIVNSAITSALRVALSYFDPGEAPDLINKFLNYLSLLFSQRAREGVKKYYKEVGLNIQNGLLFNCSFEDINEERNKRFLVIEKLLTEQPKYKKLTPALRKHLNAIHVNVLEMSEDIASDKVFICVESILFSRSHMDMFFKNRIIVTCPCNEENTFYSHQSRLRSKIKMMLQDLNTVY